MRRVLLAGLLIACASQDEPARTAADASATAAKTFVYRCDGEHRIIVRDEGDRAWVFVREGTFALRPVAAASGAKFSDGTVTFWSKGAEAMLETATRTYRDCENRPGEAVWEAAKLDGVHFRAVGQEPGWAVEIRDEHIDLLLDYGQTGMSIPVRVETGDRRTTYHGTGEDHVLRFELTGTPCRDTMSGEAFPTTVELRIDGRVLAGCGRPLH